MKHRLIVISAGDFGREVAWFARAIPPENRDWEFHGFLDDRRGILDSYPGEGPILDAPHTYQIQSEDRFICAIGDPEPRLCYANLIEARGGIFTTLIHPSACIGDRTVIGSGTIVCQYSVITTDITIGNHVSIMAHCLLGHNVQVGNGSIISSFSFLGGYSQVGTGAFLAPHAVIVPRKKVGDFATVGAGSVVLRSVKARTTVFGHPAQTVIER